MIDGLTDSTPEAWQSVESRFARHYRSGRYTRSESSHKGVNSQSGRGGVKATLLDMPICAIDGEGKTRSDGSHHYTLLAASWPGGRRKLECASLTTQQCLDFLLDLPEHHTYVGYGLSYDTNMILRGLPRKVINALLDTGRGYWKSYEIRWIERKFLSIRRGGRHVTVYDVLANWQVTFVKACKDWGIGTDEQLAIVQRMKDQRGNFDAVDDADISDYCYLECDLLGELCRKFFDAIKETPYRPNAVYGPGALAAAAMRHHGVQKRMAQLPEHIEYLAQKAYFGGRFDCAMFGWFSDVWQYDIKSAYPDQIRYLPCLAHAEWQYVEQGASRVQPQRYGVYHVEWNVPENSPWPPFPHRDSHGNVYYPYRGAGWYHGDEINAAIELYGSDAINVTNGYNVVANCDHKPFDFVDSIFDIRKKLESEGKKGQGVVFKLIMNSLYGKLAQQVGSKGDRKPRFQCFYWAGAITAGTRAKILRNLAQCPDQVIGIATDSLVSCRKLDIDEGKELGEWEYKNLTEYAQISNGLYAGKGADGEEIERGRGIGRYVLDWKRVRADYVKSRGCGYHEFAGRARFITMREARSRTDRDQVECRWIGPGTPNRQAPRRLNFWPTRRWPEAYDKRGPTMRLTPLQPDDYGADLESQIFRVKRASNEVVAMREKYNSLTWQDYE